MGETPRYRTDETEPAQSEEERLAESPAGNIEPPGGMGTAAGGGHGSGSERSSGGSGDGEHAAGDDPETEWLRRVNDGETPAPVSSND